MGEDHDSARPLPGPLGFLAPARRDAVRREYAARLTAGDDAERVIGELALQHGLAPSFVRILLGPQAG